MKILVTGGAGFIGSAFVRMAIADTELHVVNFDKLTYAGNLENLAPVAASDRYRFVHGDICDAQLVEATLIEERPDAIVHFAAESHVDRSILSPEPVVRTNFHGTFTLLEAARRHNIGRFVHVSTDEVYGSLEAPAEADEKYPLNPSSPYSASKAASDLLARSYFVTYKLPVVMTRASNNYGPYQFPEKLIPLMIANALEDQPLPVYGDGQQVRDWLYVDDHCRGILAVLIRAARERSTISAAIARCRIWTWCTRCWRSPESRDSLIHYVKDRPGHDRRYALSSEKLMRETGWQPLMDFEIGLARTIEWYRANSAWVARVRSGEYRTYYERNYGDRAPVS